jgi:predicted component of type VI protein secretion system
MLFIIEITFEGETRELETEKPEVIVGRSTPVEEVDIDLSPDKMVSRKHIILKIEYNMATAKNEAWIHDQGSSRGTLLNGEPVTDPVKVNKEDVIQVGESEIRVRLKKKPKPKSKMSFQEKVEARSKSFGESKSKRKPKDKISRDKLSGLPIMVEPDPPPAEEPPPPPAEEPPSPPAEELPISSQDEVSPGVAAALLSGACHTESAGFVAYSVEDLATAVNRYARENKMHAISASVVQEGKGASACFRALVVFSNPNAD